MPPPGYAVLQLPPHTHPANDVRCTGVHLPEQHGGSDPPEPPEGAHWPVEAPAIVPLEKCRLAAQQLADAVLAAAAGAAAAAATVAAAAAVTAAAAAAASAADVAAAAGACGVH